MTGSSSGKSVYVGREAELATLQEALAAAVHGTGSLVLLSGEPGIGKTRTAKEIARRAGEFDARVLWGRCYEGEGAPAYWPWVQVLRGLLQGHDETVLRGAAAVPELARLVPGFAGSTPAADDESEQ